MLLRNMFAKNRNARKRSEARRLSFEPLEDRRMLAQTVGLLVNEPESFEGYTLFAPSVGTQTYLIDHDGHEVNTWQSDYQPMSAYLIADPNNTIPGFEDGDMIRAGRLPDTQYSMNAGGGAGIIELFDWDGNLKWHYSLNEVDDVTPNPNDDDGIHDRRLHHDFEVMPNGNILMIAWERYSNAEEVAHGRQADLSDSVWPDMIIEVKPDFDGPVDQNGVPYGGDIVWEWHLWDHVVQDKFPNKPNYGNVADNPHKIDLNFTSQDQRGGAAEPSDWAHFNAIDYNPYLDQIVVSPREFSEFWVIDHSTTTQEAAGSTGGRSGMGGDILYRWGSPYTYDSGAYANQQMAYQHDAQWIERGLPGEQNFLVFDNGMFRGGVESYSAVHEVVASDNEQWVFNNDIDGSIDDLVIFGTKSLNYLDDFANLDNPWSSTWLPVTGDWNADGIDTGGFYDPDNDIWLLSNNTGAAAWNDLVAFDGPGGVGTDWAPIAGNWDGVGGDSVGFYDPLTQTFHLSNANGAYSEDVTIVASQAGISQDWQPLVGDWNNNGVDTVGVRNPFTNDWYLNNDTGTWDSPHYLPAPGVVPLSWTPITGDWDGDGYDTVGLYDPTNNNWYLNNRTDGSWNPDGVDATVIQRPVDVPDSWIPLTGDWNGNDSDAVGFYKPVFYSKLPGKAFGQVNPIWSYTATPKSDFYAPIISGAHRLPNGNTIVDEGTEGRFFEVTPEGDIVWEYINPFSVQADGPPGMLDFNEASPPLNFQGIPSVYGNLTFRAYRYAPDYIPQLATAEPSGPLEKYPDYFDTPGLYDPTNEDWYLNNHADDTLTDVVMFNVGDDNPENWLPVAGDWDGNGADSVGLYDPDNQVFHLNNSIDGTLDGYFAIVASQTGLNATWQPIAGDWNNDGVDTVGLRDPLTNNWYLNNDPGAWNSPHFLPAPGITPLDWIPIAGDWDGDGFDTVGLYDPTNNDWYLNNRIDGQWIGNGVDGIIIDRPAQEVPKGWIPLAGDWNGNGRDSVALYDPDNADWYLNNRIDGSIDDLVIIRGHGEPDNWLPIVGDWDGTRV